MGWFLVLHARFAEGSACGRTADATDSAFHLAEEEASCRAIGWWVATGSRGSGRKRNGGAEGIRTLGLLRARPIPKLTVRKFVNS